MSIGQRIFKLPKRTIFAFGLMLALGGMLSISGTQLKASATGQDCDNNAIIKCGFSSASNFISTVKANDSGNGHSDLKNIYAYYGLQSSSYNDFVASARVGTAYSDGRIVVDGQTVATGAKSVGRIASVHGSGYFTTNVPNGPSLYGNTVNKTFASSSIPVMVMFDSQGQVKFAVLTSCGNPIYGKNTPANYTCNSIKKSAVTGKPNTYSFTASASDSGNATITKYTYDFGDGTPSVSTTSPTAAVEHTYANPGTFTASVTITVKLPGNQNVTATSAPCKTTITVVAPYSSCVQLTGAILDQSKYNYSFTATAKYGNGAVFNGADFNFGDGNTVTDIKPSGTTVSTSHQYAKAGNYQVTATLHFTGNGKSSSIACTAAVTPTQPPTPECKPGVPEGSPLCTPCQYDSNLPANDSKCAPAVVTASTTPTALVNTGPGAVIAIFGVVMIAGAFIYRQFIYKKHAVAGNAAAMNLHHQMLTSQHKHVEHHATHVNRNSENALHHPTYSKPSRFRPGKK